MNIIYDKKMIVSSILLANMVSLIAYAAPNFSYQADTQNPALQQSYYPTPINAQNNQLQGSVVTVPANQEIPAFLTAPISSTNAVCGQTVSLSLNSDFTYNDQMIAPAGSTVLGTVIEVSTAKRGSRNGKLCIRFTQINTPYGLQIPISGVIKTDDNSGVLVGGTKADVAKDYAKDMAVGAGAGALTGLVAGAISGGAVGKTTAIMTGIGAGGGVVKSAWDKGDEIEIPAGASIDIVLTQPITVAPSAYDYDN